MPHSRLSRLRYRRNRKIRNTVKQGVLLVMIQRLKDVIFQINKESYQIIQIDQFDHETADPWEWARVQRYVTADPSQDRDWMDSESTDWLERFFDLDWTIVDGCIYSLKTSAYANGVPSYIYWRRQVAPLFESYRSLLFVRSLIHSPDYHLNLSAKILYKSFLAYQQEWERFESMLTPKIHHWN